METTLKIEIKIKRTSSSSSIFLIRHLFSSSRYYRIITIAWKQLDQTSTSSDKQSKQKENDREKKKRERERDEDDELSMNS